MLINFANRWVSLLLIASTTMFIQGCGGGGTDPEPPTPNPISIAITGPLEVKEGSSITITSVVAAATKFSWSIDNRNVVLEGADSASVTFTGPDVDNDTPVILTLTASDTKGNSKSATYTVKILRKVSTITISGLVTDNFIANATLEIFAGGEMFQATADATGNYSVVLAIDENRVNKLVTIVAKGDKSINAGVEFVSILPSFSTLKEQAGSDGVLNKDDNFGVNITNVTTAEYVLVNRENSNEEITTEEQLTALTAAVDSDEKLKLAAVIKVVVDDPDFLLPEGVDSTLALIENPQSTQDFISVVEAQAPGTIDDTVEVIKDDDTLVDQPTTITSGSFIVTNPLYYRTSSDHLLLNVDGTGVISTSEIKESAITWSQQDNLITITPTTPIMESVSYCYDDNDTGYDCNLILNSIDLEVFNQKGDNYDVKVTYSRIERDVAATIADVPKTSTFVNNLMNKATTATFDNTNMIGQWHVGYFGWSLDDQGVKQGEIGADLDLLADGTGTAIIESTSYSLTWSVGNNELMLSLPNYSYVDESDQSIQTGLVNTYWLVKNKTDILQTSAITEDTRATSSMWVKIEDGAMFDLNNTVGRWYAYEGDNDAVWSHEDIYADNSYMGSWGGEREWAIENGVFVRYQKRSLTNLNGDEEIVNYQRVEFHLLSTIDGRLYMRRLFHLLDWTVWDTTGQVEYTAPFDNIFVYEHSTETPPNRFETYQMDGGIFYLVAKDPSSGEVWLDELNFAEEDDVSNPGNMINVINANDYYDSTDTWQDIYNIIAGKLVGENVNDSTDNFVAEMTSYTQDYIGACIYPQGSTCAADGEDNRFYFYSKLVEAEAYYNELTSQVVTTPPASTSPIAGAWTFTNNTELAIVFTDDGHYMHMEKASPADEADPNCSSGFEVGTYSWNESTSAFSIVNIKDTNGCIGLWDSSDNNAGTTFNTITVNGDVLTLNMTEDSVTSDITLNRVISSTNSFVGAFLEGDLDNDFWLQVTLNDTHFIEVGNDVSDGEVGVNIGTYTLDTNTSLLNFANDATLVLNQLNSTYDETVTKIYDDILIWKDGESAGVLKRIGLTNLTQAYLTEQDVIGTFDISDELYPNEVLRIQFKSDYTFEVLAGSNGTPTGTFNWELQYGQLILLMDPDANVADDEEMDIWSPVNISNSPWNMNVAFFQLYSAPDDKETNSYEITTGTFTTVIPANQSTPQSKSSSERLKPIMH